MKYCINCGSQLSDQDKFCTKCGAPQGAQQSNTQPVEQGVQQQSNAQPVGQSVQQQSYTQPDQSYIYQQPIKTSGKFSAKGAALLVGIVVVALGVIYLLFQLFTGGSGSIEKAVEEYYEAICDKDGDTLLEVTCTDSMVRALEESSGYEKDDIAYALEVAIDYSYEDFGKVRNVKVEEQDKMTKAELSQGLEEIKDETGVDVKISEMREVEVTFEYYDTYYEEWDEDTEYLIVYKSGSKWYVFPDAF